MILSPGFPENEEDTTCLSHLQTFIRAIQRARPDLTLIILTFQYPFFSKEYLWNGIRVISFGNKYNNRALNLFTGLRVWLSLKRLNKGYQIIGLLSFWFGKCALVGSDFAKKYNYKHYCWVLGQDAKPANKYLKKVKPGSESLIIVSDFIAQSLYKNYGIRPLHIIPMGIEPALFNTEDTPRDIDILGVGSLTALKQYTVFLEVITLLKVKLPGIKAAICGEGPQTELLVSMVKTLGIENNISFIGSIPHVEALAIMKKAKILLHPSNYEGFSTVCMEALYAGAKVISFIKPMAFDIQNWHIAADKKEMANIAVNILQDTQTEYQPGLPYAVYDCAKAITNLFDPKERVAEMQPAKIAS